MNWARVENNFVMEVIDYDPTGLYHPDLIWIECPPETQQRWYYDETVPEFRPSTPQDMYTFEEYQDVVAGAVFVEAEKRRVEAEMNPELNVYLRNDRHRTWKNIKRDNKAKRKVNKISDADDHLYNHLEDLSIEVDAAMVEIDAATDFATLEAIEAGIPTRPNWPIWQAVAP